MKAPFALSILVALTAVTRGAVITWSPALNTTGKSQLIEGTVVQALNGGANAPVVTGGGAGGTTTYTFTAVNFTSLGPDNSFVVTAGGPTARNRTTANVYSPSTLTSTGDPDFDAMVATFTDPNGTTAGITAGTLMLGGLTDGTRYLIQVFYNDQRSASADRVMTYGDGLGNTVNVGSSATPGAQTTDYGQHAVGSFTAIGTTQELTLLANGFANVHFNAILVAATPTPLTLINPVLSGGEFSASFQSRTGVFYDVLYKNNLSDPTWHLLTTLPGDDTVLTFTDPGPAVESRFYRLEVWR